MVHASSDRAWRVYLGWWVAALLATVAGVGFFNFAIDPLGVFDSPRVAGVNAIKPHLDHDRDFSRWRAGHRLCASTGIFGNSRAEIGFDPESPALTRGGLDAFNHAIPGTGASTSRRQLAWLDATHCLPRTVVLGVEFFDFLGGGPITRRTGAVEDAAPTISARFLAESVFSLTGLRDSIQTLLLQHQPDPAIQTPRGFNPLYNYRAEVAQSGHYVLFRQRAEENARRWSASPHRIVAPDGGASQDEEDVTAMLDRSLNAGSMVYLVIYPYHAEVRLMMERLGLSPLFAEWKRRIVALATRRAAELGGRVEVWDFSALSNWTLEPVPPPGDRQTRLRYYWEAGHFKKELGDLALTRLMGEPGRFGQRLEPAMLEAWLAADRQQLDAALANRSALVAEVDDVLARVAGK